MEHRGEIVLKILTQRGIKKTEIADQIDIHRQTLYNQLERADMKSHYILRIGEQIGFDFSTVIPSLKKEIKETTATPDHTAAEVLEELDINIHLDGTEETLQRIFRKLTRVNESLRFS